MFERVRGKIKIHEPEAEVLKLFIEAWKEKSGKDYVESFPFANQDNWTGTSVMEFAKFIVRKKNEDIKSALEGFKQDLGAKYGVTTIYGEIIDMLKKWFPDFN